MIRPIRKRLWTFNHGNTRLAQGSLSSRVLEELYPDKKKILTELCDDTISVKMTMNRLEKRCFVTQDSDRRYALTDLGRWFAISSILKISFLELCVLACACCTHQRYSRSAKAGFYMHSTFEGILKEYYSRNYISWIFSSLKRKGFAIKLVKRIIQIHPRRCKSLLSRYGEDFKRLESWLDRLEEGKLEILSRALDGFELGGGQE